MALPHAVIFDLDGTLVDSIEDIALALDAALSHHGLPRPTRDMVRGWVGGGARDLICRAVGAAPADLIAPVLATFRTHYAASPVAHTQLYAGVAEVLDALAAARRPLGVLSNKPHALTVEISRRLLARWPFAEIAGQRDGAAIKPDPTGALAMARALGVAPADTALVGDAATDVATAHAAGMQAIAVTWGFRPRAELVAAAPAYVVDQPFELVALLAGSPG